VHKVDSSGATAQNEFTNGDPATQTPRTRLEAKWMNSAQRELIRIVEQTGRAPSDADDNQLSKSVVLWCDGGAAGIRALPIPTGAVVVIERNTLGRAYAWDSTSAAADDGTTVIRPSSNPATGRWLRHQFSHELIGSYPWSRLTGVPASFPPSAHTHVAGDITRTIVEGYNAAIVNMPVGVQSTIVSLAPITVSTSSIVFFTARAAIAKSGTAGETMMVVEFIDGTGQVRLPNGRNYVRVNNPSLQPSFYMEQVVSGFVRCVVAGTVTPRLVGFSWGGAGFVPADEGHLSVVL
jgi:hypothetical protein